MALKKHRRFLETVFQNSQQQQYCTSQGNGLLSSIENAQPGSLISIYLIDRSFGCEIGLLRMVHDLCCGEGVLGWAPKAAVFF